MLKKFVFALILALQLAAAANVTRTPVPWPDCWPCDQW